MLYDTFVLVHKINQTDLVHEFNSLTQCASFLQVIEGVQLSVNNNESGQINHFHTSL